jgi:hypothetical protein
MAASPSNTHAVSAIRNRLAEVSGELIAVEKRWRSLREAHHALSQTLRIFDPDADAGQIKPKRPYRRVVPSGSGKLSRSVIDVLRSSDRPMTTLEVVAALGERANGILGVRGRVLAILNYLARSGGLVVKTGQGQSAMWSLSSPRAEAPEFSLGG